MFSDPIKCNKYFAYFIIAHLVHELSTSTQNLFFLPFLLYFVNFTSHVNTLENRFSANV